MSRLAVVLAITACVGVIATEGASVAKLKKNQTHLVGALVPMDPKDPVLMKGLLDGIAQKNLDVFPLKINLAWQQTVSGVMYRVDFVTENRVDCHASWVIQSWVSDMPDSFRCLCAVNPPH